MSTRPRARGVVRQQIVDDHRVLLADANEPVLGLYIHARAPVPLHHEHVAGSLEVQPDPAGLQLNADNVCVPGLECPHRSVTARLAHVAVYHVVTLVLHSFEWCAIEARHD